MRNKNSRNFCRYFILTISSIFLITLTVLANSPTHWSYSGQERPNNWAKLSPDFATCSTGEHQSPINFELFTAKEPANLLFNYQDTPLNIINNGHTIQINYAKGSTIKIDQKEYELMQFHFHTPSEHTIEGKATEMELHLVHKNQKGEMAVVALFIKSGQEHPLIKEIWQHINLEEGGQIFKTSKINAKDFIAIESPYYHYTGSLTTPPCTEGVNWIVFKTPLEMSTEQIKKFSKIYQLNARPVQPLNQRRIVLRE